MHVRRWLGAVLVAMAIATCSGSAVGAGSASSSTASSASVAATVRAVDLEIYAAASLKAALAMVKETYEAAHPGTSLTVSTDSSAALETKIEQGAPADVFLSADTTNPKKLVDGGFAAGPVVAFAGNLLTVIVPTANPASLRTPADLARRGVKIIAAGDTVPVTKYAGQLVANLAKEPGYPAGFADAYAGNVVSREDNVAAVVTKIALGEGYAGIVYATDAKASDKVTAIDVPASANVPATYGGLVPTASSHAAAAAAFLAWLAGPDGQAVLSTFGFLPPG